MAVKVGNSWVSEAALSYAKVKAAGTIINADGSVSGWAITEDDKGDERAKKRSWTRTREIRGRKNLRDA